MGEAFLIHQSKRSLFFHSSGIKPRDWYYDLIVLFPSVLRSTWSGEPTLSGKTLTDSLVFLTSLCSLLSRGSNELRIT
jgi:hypothetical protein